MIEIRFHGRGGQGAVVASKILASAVFHEGKYVQSFPLFGVERRGAPVAAFTRIDDSPIRLRCNVYNPHHVVVLDPTLLATGLIIEGMMPGGTILINTPKLPADFPELAKTYRLATVDAARIARGHRLGSSSYPIVNTTILGAFARQCGLVQLDSIIKALGDELGAKVEANAQAATDAYNNINS